MLAPKECIYYSFTRNVNPISKLKVSSKKVSQRLKGKLSVQWFFFKIRAKAAIFTSTISPSEIE